jgi:hypothetical protein
MDVNIEAFVSFVTCDTILVINFEKTFSNLVKLFRDIWHLEQKRRRPALPFSFVGLR